MDDLGGEENAIVAPDEDEAAILRHFNLAQCLFCNQQSASLIESMSHMQKRHGVFIPNPDSLIVDVETLVGYLHLVVFEYAECLYCGSIRNTPQAAQQHMTGKGHCQIDITKDNSEFRDFYDFDPSSGSDDDEGTSVSTADRFPRADGKTRRLTSGKVVTHRNAKKPRAHQPIARLDQDNMGNTLLERPISQVSKMSPAVTQGSRGGNKELAAAAKRNMLFNKQLATMRSKDRQALMHLPLPQPRALVAKAKRQQEKWNREQVAQEIKRQVKANPVT